MKRIALLAATLILPFFGKAQDETFHLVIESETEGVARGVYENLHVVKSPPRTGTFFSLQLTNMPPWPVNPFPELPVYSLGDVYIFDDWDVDWIAIKEQGFPLFGFAETDSKKGGMQMMMDGPPVPGEGGGEGGSEGTNSPPLFLTSTNLCLWPPFFLSSNSLSLVATNTQPAGIYDLFNTTNLASDVPGLNLTNWLWVVRGTVGQTNFILTDVPITHMQSYYLLGTMQDSDSDGLTDAYEQLVSHTDLDSPDTDGDGLSDYYELLNGLSPFVTQSIPSLSSISAPKCPVP